MKNLTRIFVTALVLVLGASVWVWAGQNSGAAIRIDFDYTTPGNQNQNSISPPGTGVDVWLEVHVTGASNLDTYEFNLNYPSSDLTFKSAYEDNPFSGENNFLRKNGGSTVGWGATDYGTYVNIRNTLEGNQGEDTPDGEGLLALVKFTTKVDAPGNLTFGAVEWYDNNGVKDVCTDKGEASLPVQLSSFSGTSGDGTVTLRWITQSEINNLGFNLHRSLRKDRDYVKINGELIPGAGSSAVAHTYSYTDKRLTNGITYWYKLEDVDLSGKGTMHGPISAIPQAPVKPEPVPVPKIYKLAQSYPNPFNPTTTIRYQLPEECHVVLNVYNILGQLVKTLVDESKPAGWYSVHWDGKDSSGKPVASGIYLYQIQAKDFIQIKKMTLIR